MSVPIVKITHRKEKKQQKKKTLTFGLEQKTCEVCPSAQSQSCHYTGRAAEAAHRGADLT